MKQKIYDKAEDMIDEKIRSLSAEKIYSLADEDEELDVSEICFQLCEMYNVEKEMVDELLNKVLDEMQYAIRDLAEDHQRDAEIRKNPYRHYSVRRY